MSVTSKSLDCGSTTTARNGHPMSTVHRSFFSDKLDYMSLRKLIEARSEHHTPAKSKYVDYANVWNIKPVDFTMKLYHPRPPKRNSRDAIRPWEYDKYLRPRDEESDSRYNEVTKSADERMVEEYLRPKGGEGGEGEEEEFERMFRPVTPNKDRVEMATKKMAYRSHLDKYEMWKPHDFRGLQPLGEMPDIKTRFERDPYGIKFLSERLTVYNGAEQAIGLRPIDPGLQMGEKVRTPDPHYDPKLILPRLPFPNRFHGYSRFRPLDRSVESAFWDRALPKINEKFVAVEKMSHSVEDLSAKTLS